MTGADRSEEDRTQTMDDAGSSAGERLGAFDPDSDERITAVSDRPLVKERVAERPSDQGTLTLITGPNAGVTYTVLAEESVIGRGKDCAIWVDGPGVSRRHARILRQA